MEPPPKKRAKTDEKLVESLPSSGLRNTLHGNVFQLKLLMLFLIRGLKMPSPCKFKLDTEMPDKGGKFDDLIFTYENRESGRKTSRYLQAKHKLEDSTKIRASDLLNQSDGDFSLKKYFRSYREICKTLDHNEDLKDCIIGTNIGFDEDDLKQKGIKLVSLSDQDSILDFNTKQTSGSKKPVWYKLQDMEGTTNLYKKLEETSDMHCLAHELLKCGNDGKKLELKCALFKKYHYALVKENVLDLSSTTFHKNFIDNVKLSANAEKFHKMLSNCQSRDDWTTLKFDFSKGFGKMKKNEQSELPRDPVHDKEIESFLNKLVFAVNLPNEEELGRIISDEIGIDFNVLDNRFMTSEFLSKMLNWFKDKHATTLSNTKAESIIKEIKEMMTLMHATGASISYRDELCKEMTFKQDAIDGMTEKLKSFLCDSNLKKQVLRIATAFPKYSAIKIVQSLTQSSKFKEDDSYLIVESKNLREDKERVQMRKILGAERSHNLLVVVCNNDTEQKWDELIPNDPKSKKIIIVETKANTVVPIVNQ